MWSAKRETTRKKAPSSSSSSSSKSSRNNREYSRNHRIIERIIISFCQSNDDGLDFTWTFESLKQLMSAEFSFQSSPARPGERERVLVVFHSVVVVVVFLVFVLVVFRPMRSSSFGIERPLAALLIQRRFPDVVERPHLVLVLYSFLSLFTTQNGGKTNRRRLIRVVVVVVLLFFSLFLSFSVGRSVSML